MRTVQILGAPSKGYKQDESSREARAKLEVWEVVEMDGCCGVGKSHLDMLKMMGSISEKI